MTKLRKNIWLIKWSKNASKSLDKLSDEEIIRIISKIDELSDDPYLGYPLKGTLSQYHKMRVGDNRIIYQIRKNELVVLIVKIENRKDVYNET